MKATIFTHPEASWAALQDSAMASALMEGKTKAKRHNGQCVKISEFKNFTMHSQEASRFELIDDQGLLIAFFANGQFWDSLTKTLIELI